MNNKKIVILVIGLLCFLLIILPVSVTVSAHYYYFGKRIEHSNNYYEYLSELDDSFLRYTTSFKSDDDQVLSGAFYYDSELTDPNGLVVWVHGMGVNHENYLAEIQLLTKEGFVVFSYDNTGVNASEGDSLKGLSQSVIDLKHASIFIDELEIFRDLPNILIGHSWGGYAVSSVSSLELPRQYDGIVSLAGFERNINVIRDILKNHIGCFTNILVPYLNIYENFIFGENSSLNGVSGLSDSNAKVLIIHSIDDDVVSFDTNYSLYKDSFEDDNRFTFIEYTDAGHKLTVNYESYIRIHDIMHHQMKLLETDEHFLELEAERLSLITDFNEEVMNNILDFCNSFR